jgi:hypothetical protein
LAQRLDAGRSWSSAHTVTSICPSPHMAIPAALAQTRPPLPLQTSERESSEHSPAPVARQPVLADAQTLVLKPAASALNLELWSKADDDNNRLIVQWAQELQTRGGTLNTTRKAWAGLRIAAISERRLDDARRLADAQPKIYGAFPQTNRAFTASLSASVSVAEATTAIALASPSPMKSSPTPTSLPKKREWEDGEEKGKRPALPQSHVPQPTADTHGSELAFREGRVCPQCGCCSGRKYWLCWSCENCTWTENTPMRTYPADILRKEMATFEAKMAKKRECEDGNGKGEEAGFASTSTTGGDSTKTTPGGQVSPNTPASPDSDATSKKRGHDDDDHIHNRPRMS